MFCTHYEAFAGVLRPTIVECVSLPLPVSEKIFKLLLLLTVAVKSPMKGLISVHLSLCPYFVEVKNADSEYFETCH